jgi:G2/mitotic-specific cyclin 2
MQLQYNPIEQTRIINPQRRVVSRPTTLHDENKVQKTRVTRSKLISTDVTTTTTTTTTALTSKIGIQNAVAATRKRAALGDVTNAHKKSALADITNAIVKPQVEKPAVVTKRPTVRKPSSLSTVNPVESTTTAKPVTSKSITTTTSTVVPKKRPSESVTSNAQPRRTLKQTGSSSTLARKSTVVRPSSRLRVEDNTEQEAPRKKQKVEPKQDWDDLDAVDGDDPLMVSEYVVEIFDYLRELEVLLDNFLF